MVYICAVGTIQIHGLNLCRRPTGGFLSTKEGNPLHTEEDCLSLVEVMRGDYTDFDREPAVHGNGCLIIPTVALTQPTNTPDRPTAEEK